MAREALEPQIVATTGTTLTFTAVGADGVAIPFDGETWFDLLNDSGDPITPAVVANYSAEGVALGNKSLGAIADGTGKTYRPWKHTEFKQETGELWINGEGIKIAVYKK